VIERCRLPTSVERVLIGGRHAAINALKVARLIMRSEPDARLPVLLCKLHLRDAHELEDCWGFFCSPTAAPACLVTAERGGSLSTDSARCWSRRPRT
jgi:alpha-pyrone synthase